MSWLLLFLYMTIGVGIGSLIDLLVLQSDVDNIIVRTLTIEVLLLVFVITGAVFMGGKVW